MVGVSQEKIFVSQFFFFTSSFLKNSNLIMLFSSGVENEYYQAAFETLTQFLGEAREDGLILKKLILVKY